MLEEYNPEIERQNRTEILIRFLDSATNIEPLHGGNLKDKLSDDESKRQFIHSLTEQEFITLLNGVNGILRGKEKTDWNMDGGEVMLGGFTEEHFPPREQDKVVLLHEAHLSAERMNDASRSIEDIALLLSASINEVHAYADGNGRTSRLIYTLLTRGYNDEVRARLPDLLSEEGREYLDVNPLKVNRYLEAVMFSGLGVNDEETNPLRLGNCLYEIPTSEFAFDDSVPEEDRQALRSLVRQDPKYAFYALFPYIYQIPDREKYVDTFPTHASIRVDRLTPVMNPEDVKQVVENYWHSKKEHAELLMDCVENFQNPEYQIEVGGKDVSLLEYFKSNLKG